MPVHGLDAQMGVGRPKFPVSHLPVESLVLYRYADCLVMNAYDYPLIVGRNPTSVLFIHSQSFTNLLFCFQLLVLYLACFS